MPNADDPASGNKVPEASKGTYVQWQGDVSAQQLVDGLEIPDLKAGSAYYAIITPGVTGGKTENELDGTYEAEYAHVADKNNNVSTVLSSVYAEGASGAGYVTGFEKATADNGDANKFFVTSQKDGYSNITVRYAADKDSKLLLKINRTDALTLNLPSTNGAWGEATVRAYLPLGISELDFAAPDNAAEAAGVKLDDIKLADDADTAVQKIEAESETNLRDGQASVFDDAKASGGKAVGNVGNNKGTLTFNVSDVAEAGDYTLTFGYAHLDVADSNDFQTKNRWADVSVNDGDTQQVVFANTRHWDDYWTTSIRVNLKKGKNVIKVDTASAKQGWAPNFDYLQIGRTAVQTSPEPSPEPGPSVDKSALQALISQAKGVAEKDYTKESYAKLVDALKSAETVNAKVDASQNEVNSAVDALQKALDGLEKIKGNASGVIPDDADKSDGKGSDDILGNTGVAVSVIAGIAIVLGTCGAVLVCRRRRA